LKKRGRGGEGEIERWRDGAMEGWRDGEMEGWRDGGMERWRDATAGNECERKLSHLAFSTPSVFSPPLPLLSVSLSLCLSS